jgi:L-aminopeptidase/D-esterase-like protein
VARAAADGMARRIVPVGTAFDGDIVFACAAGSAPGTALQVEQLARAAVETAILRAVRAARGRDGIPGLAG